MARVWRNAVKETSTTIGDGPLTLDGAYSASFNTFYHPTLSPVGSTGSYTLTNEAETFREWGEWELLDETTLSRTPAADSNGGVPLDLEAGTHIVFITPLAQDFDDVTTGPVAASRVTGVLATDTIPALAYIPLADIGDLPYIPIGDLNGLPYVPTTEQSGRKFAASPADGTSGPITLRAITAADLPALPYVASVGLTVPTFLSSTPASITGSDTFVVTLATQPANAVFAGPSTGVDATPTFRSLVAADIPTITTAMIGALAVTDTKIADVAASKITGTIANAQLPSTIDGKTITNSSIGSSNPSTGAFTTVTTSGNAGFGVAPGAGRVEVRNAGEQLRLSYDASNFTTLTTSAFGVLTVTPSVAQMSLVAKLTTTASYSLQGHNIEARNAFYFPNHDLLMAPAAAVSDSGNSYNFTNGSGTTLRQIRASSLRIGATIAGSAQAVIDPTGAATFAPTDALTGVTNALTLGHNSTGTVTTDFGGKIPMQAEGASGTENLDVASIEWAWEVATELTRRGRMRLKANYHTTARTVIEVGADSSGPLLGLNGNAAVARATYVSPTGTLSRATFDASTVTLEQLAQRVAALITDFRSRGDFA